MKRLYLMRHGHSPSTAEARVAKDALRPLSDQGREDARRMAAELARRGGRPTLILHSPLTRAVQTAAEAASVLKPAAGTIPFVPLDNTRPAEEVAAELLTRAEGDAEVLAVGHQPQIGEVAALFGKAIFEMRPGTIVALELAPEPRLLWSLSPEQL
ncbi:MAG: histidine phosphatase family protein [Elusimicrobia bacterium]|nr:histidine phosphatase family protein [Elusimicrobiota bacterium]